MTKKPEDVPDEVPVLSATQEKSARLKALRLENDRAVAQRVEKATRKARARRDILGK